MIISSQLYICEILEIPLHNLKCTVQNKESVEKFTLLDIKSNVTSLTEEFISSSDTKKVVDDNNKQYYEISSSKLLVGTNNSKLIPFTLTLTIGHFPKLSLGRTYTNKNYSLIHYLYNNKIINDKSFSISISHSPEQRLYFGGIPKNIIKNKTQIKIQTSDKYKGWAFPIDSISIANLTFAVNKLGLLGLDSGSIIVNREIYLFLKDK